jgi:putative transposase
MLCSVVYFLLRLVLRIAPKGDERDREAEILVLRHQLKVLTRRRGRPKLRRMDRVLLAAFSSLVPRERWNALSVSPQTLLRWHRELVRRKWTYKRNGGGRPPLDAKIRDLVLTMAKDNPNWGYMRIKGELQKLGIRVAANTIRTILQRVVLDRLPGVAPVGRSSSARKPTESLRVTSSRLRPRSCARSTCCSSSRLKLVACM